MNSNVVKTVKEHTQNMTIYDHSSTNKIFTEMQSLTLQPSELFQFAFVLLHFKENELLANDLLVDLLPKLKPKEQLLLIKKLTVYSEKFIEHARKLVYVKELKAAIEDIFQVLNITIPENSNAKLESLADIAKLLESINTSEFKKTRNKIQPIVRKYSHLLPKLSETGFRNLSILKAIDIFVNDYTGIHPSETIRVEWFRKCFSFANVYKFVQFNQIINSSVNRKAVISEFANKLDLLEESCAYNTMFPVFVELLLNGVIKHMCMANNPVRRNLGAGLLCEIIKHGIKLNDKRNIPIPAKCYILQLNKAFGSCLTETITVLANRLFYDVNKDIRIMLSEFIWLDNKTVDYHIGNLISHEYPKIRGAVICLMNFDANTIVEKLNVFVQLNDARIYGLMYLLNVKNHLSNKYQELVELISYQYKKESCFWKIQKECCFFYKNNNEFDKIMAVLLETDHLGLICYLNELLGKFKANNIDSYAQKGIKKIENNGKNCRKSGGISTYFVKLVNDENDYYKIKELLCALICDEESKATTNEINNKQTRCEIQKLKNMSVHVIFHVLNVFISLFERISVDQPFAILLGISCLEHNNFSIKNCGFTIITNVIKKVMLEYGCFDPFFICNTSIRKTLKEILKKSIITRNKHIIYFIMMIYERTTVLMNEENEILQACIDIDELIRIKVLAILNKRNIEITDVTSDDFLEPKTTHNITSCNCKNKSCKIHSITTALLMLNTHDNVETKSLVKQFKLIPSSNEYLMYQLVNLAKEYKIRNEIKDAIQKYYESVQKCTYLEDDEAQNVYNPDFDCEYLMEMLSC